MDAWIGWRLIKFLAVAALAAGIGLASSRQAADRARGAILAPAGLLGAWIAGYGMMKATGATLREPWISAGMAGGLIALGAAQQAGRQGGIVWGCLAWAGLGASTGAMVGRRAGWIAPALIGAAAGALIGLLSGTRAGEAAGDAGAVTAGDAGAVTAFWWWARLEGLSAILLFFVYMPAKYGAGVVLDGGQGWFGWIHGALTVIYFSALPSARRGLGWDARTTALAVAAALVPAGTFWLEARARR